MEEMLQQFFTLASVATFGGASGAVYVLTNTVRILFNTASPIPAFIAVLLISYLGALSSGALTEPLAYFVAFLNACLLFLTALGFQTTTRSRQEVPPSGAETRVKWRTPWL
jgi:hypothetical protein